MQQDQTRSKHLQHSRITANLARVSTAFVSGFALWGTRVRFDQLSDLFGHATTPLSAGATPFFLALLFKAALAVGFGLIILALL